jgi:hypothetical protein
MGQIIEFRRRKDDFVRPAGFDTEAAILERRFDAPKIGSRRAQVGEPMKPDERADATGRLRLRLV